MICRVSKNTWRGGNKLRTYRRFESDVYTEPYLLHVVDDRKPALLLKFRSGDAPLPIETGIRC